MVAKYKNEVDTKIRGPFNEITWEGYVKAAATPSFCWDLILDQSLENIVFGNE